MKSFIVRLLQVTWILSLLLAAWLIILGLSNGDLEEMFVILGSLAFLFAIIVIVQYLVFAELNPKSLFDGSLIGKNTKT